ncbi:MAG: sigma 54-interacting transcriptional regulator [Thermodesulfobacteriota bacterium]|nr:sigma 54-interacting transcriptional regulator [Thermodesulfobacteriota bacterium]
MRTRFYISLQIILPIIFAGLATLSAIVAFQITEYSIKNAGGSSLPIFLWVVIIAALTFLCGTVIARLLLGPVKKFIGNVKQYPGITSAETEDVKNNEVDELKHFAQVFDQVTNALGNVDARQFFPGIIGESESMRRVLSQAIMVAPTDSTVLMLGESGTGKKLVATSIHEHSLRKEKPFVKLTCTGFSQEQLESELFGHEKGAFTGASSRKVGKIEIANEGTIFIDEIGDVPLDIQVKLLRLLQEKEFRRIGGTRPIKVDLRFMASSKRNLPKMVNEGKFREDLYYRINVFSLQLPPLREKKEDILFLVEHFLDNSPGSVQMSSAALQSLMVYSWPGNIRELENAVEDAVSACEGGIIESEHLPQTITKGLTPHVEAILQHAQKMEAIGTIATGMAHNFRNILGGISVTNQLIQMKYTDDANLQKSIERINGFVKRGDQLVRDLMQFSRKEPRRKLGVLNLTEVLQETYNLISESFDKKVDIRFELPESLPIMGSHSGLSQVFMNLCTNARDAMPEGGKLRIEATKKGDMAEVIVSDTGYGMDRETREKCFDPFFTRKEVGKGTGLGLSTTYGIMESHGGSIHVNSEPGQGATFKLYFQMVTDEGETKYEIVPEIVRGRGQKILIVDDEAETVKSMEGLIEGLGYRSETAGSGKDAIARYKTWQPDAVLLDRNMPGMDGTGCAEKIVDYDPSAKIVMISGYDERGPDGINGQARLLIKDYLTKPVDIAELSRVLAHLFEQDG